MKMRSELTKVRGFRGPMAQARGSEEPRVLILIAEVVVSGPVKGVLQLMEAFRSEPGCYQLANCVGRGANVSMPSAESARRGVEITHVEASRPGYLPLAKKVARVAERGRQRVLEHFSPAARTRAVIAVYHELLNAAGSV